MRAVRKDWEPVAAMMDRLSMPIPEAGCYAWLGKIGTGGYAYVAYREGGRRLHRKAATVALELAGKPRPEGLEVGHSCLMEWCVNPDHLRWITHSENLQERRPFSRYKGNVCKRGHPLPPKAERGKNNSCPICYKAYQDAYRARNRTGS